MDKLEGSSSVEEDENEPLKKVPKIEEEVKEE